MTRAACRFGLHDWAKWEPLSRVQETWDGVPIGYHTVFIRSCRHCGKPRTRKVRG